MAISTYDRMIYRRTLDIYKYCLDDELDICIDYRPGGDCNIRVVGYDLDEGLEITIPYGYPLEDSDHYIQIIKDKFANDPARKMVLNTIKRYHRIKDDDLYFSTAEAKNVDDAMKNKFKEDTNTMITSTAHSILNDIYNTTFKGIFPEQQFPAINKVYFNDPATVVIWTDGSKTVVKAQNGEIYDPEKGLALCFAKKALGNKGNYYETFKKYVPEKVSDEETFSFTATSINPDIAKIMLGDKSATFKVDFNSEEKSK